MFNQKSVSKGFGCIQRLWYPKGFGWSKD